MSRKQNKEGAALPPNPSPTRGWAKVFGFPKDPRSYGEYVKRPSPNKRLLLVFEPGDEYAMMRYQHEFRLVDAKKALIQVFQGLVSPMQCAWWSPDSRIVAVSVDDPNGGLLLYNVKRRRYSLVHFNSYQEKAHITSTSVKIAVDQSEFEAIFGKEFRPPRDVSFRFAALRWFPAPEVGAWKLGAAFRCAPKAKWQPPPSKAMRAYAKEHGIELL